MQFKTEDTCSLVLFISIKIQFNQRNIMPFRNIIFLIKAHCVYFLFESQFTHFGQILFNVYEFKMVSDILGHPVHAFCPFI